MKKIDIFCDIIDNYGDIGVVYRLAKILEKKYGTIAVIRVFMNKPEVFKKLNNQYSTLENECIIGGVTYLNLEKLSKNDISAIETADIIIEAFGCKIPDIYLEKSKLKGGIWINLEYLSAEEWTKDFHLQESFTGSSILKKYFYMPGFEDYSGGVLIDEMFINLQHIVNNQRDQYIKKYIPNYDFEKSPIVISLFTYEHNFEKLVDFAEKSDKNFIFLVLGDKTKVSFINTLKKKGISLDKANIEYTNISIEILPFMTQEEYDEIIALSDINFTRGEESFVRGILSGKVNVWHAYLQEEGFQIEKVKAFLNIIKKFFKNKKTFEKYFDLVYNYNYRTENSFNKDALEDYSVILDNIDEINEVFSEFSRYIIENSNFIVKFDNFIKDKKLI